MNQNKAFDYLKTGSVVSAKSLALHFCARTHEAKKALNKLLLIEGMCCREKRVTKKALDVRHNHGGRKTYTIFWYEPRNNI